MLSGASKRLLSIAVLKEDHLRLHRVSGVADCEVGEAFSREDAERRLLSAPVAILSSSADWLDGNARSSGRSFARQPTALASRPFDVQPRTASSGTRLGT